MKEDGLQHIEAGVQHLPDLPFFFFNIAADTELCAAEVVYCYGEPSHIRLPAQHQTMLKNEQCQIIQFFVEGEVAQ